MGNLIRVRCMTNHFQSRQRLWSNRVEKDLIRGGGPEESFVACPARYGVEVKLYVVWMVLGAHDTTYCSRLDR